MIEFLQQISKLKTTKRTGWLNNNVPNPESISDHMYRMSIIAMLIKDTEINNSKLIKMALVHDIAESIAGDIGPGEMSVESKFELELKAINELQSMLPPKDGEMIKELWMEYEQNSTKEAQLCKDIDKYEMIQQCFEYEQQFGTRMQSFFDSTLGKFKHPEIIDLVQDLYKQRAEWFNG